LEQARKWLPEFPVDEILLRFGGKCDRLVTPEMEYGPGQRRGVRIGGWLRAGEGTKKHGKPRGRSVNPGRKWEQYD